LYASASEIVWFITGTSRGFGRDWAIAALERGDKVAGTARDTATLDDLVDRYGDALLPIQLDVTENPPLRVFFGELPLQLAKADYESRLHNWEQWQPVAELAQG
jgi:NADP-dependent 3-hydroxy acid dehydrogenase YdfG